MLSKAHLTSHSRMSGSRWVITPSWLSGSWRSFLYSSSVYPCHLFLISSASVRSFHTLWNDHHKSWLLSVTSYYNIIDYFLHAIYDIPVTYFITGNLYCLIPFITFAQFHIPSFLKTTSLFSQSMNLFLPKHSLENQEQVPKNATFIQKNIV